MALDYSSTFIFACVLYFAVHLFIPNVGLVFVVWVAAVVLQCYLNGKGAQSLESDDFNFSKAIALLAFVNVVIMTPNIIVNGLILYIDKISGVYDFSDTVDANLKYTSRIVGKVSTFVLCITFFILLFCRQFRSGCCRN